MALASERRSPFREWVDIASVILISAAAVLTAWCGYEAARWTALQTRLYNQADADRIAASVSSSRANTLTTIDVAMFLRYIATYSERRSPENAFIYKRFRPEMRRAIDVWLATKPLKNPNAPATPFGLPQYRLRANKEAADLNLQSSSSFNMAETANERADWYVRLTVIFASVSFLAGIGTKFVFPAQIYVIVAGFGTLIFGVIRMVELPIR